MTSELGLATLKLLFKGSSLIWFKSRPLARFLACSTAAAAPAFGVAKIADVRAGRLLSFAHDSAVLRCQPSERGVDRVLELAEPIELLDKPLLQVFEV